MSLELSECPHCGEELVEHRSAGKGRYEPYPDLRVCTECWHKYVRRFVTIESPAGKILRISRTGEIMNVVKEEKRS